MFFFIGTCVIGSSTVADETQAVSSKRKTLKARISTDRFETSPGVDEVERNISAGAVLKARKKFPWLILGLGVTATVALVLILTKKNEKPQVPPDVEVEMVSIPGGTFRMGSDSDAHHHENPEHPVSISAFYMSKYEVTQVLWTAVMGSNLAFFKKGDDYPVEQVSWNEVQTFIRKLNSISGKHYRLPTEAEWEYACRAGTTGERYGELDAIAWYIGNSAGSTQAVGQKLPNAFGLYDTLGNVWEFCQDWFGPYSPSPQVDPQGPPSGYQRVLRGGGWNFWAGDIRATNRAFLSQDQCDFSIGFRLASDQDTARLARE